MKNIYKIRPQSKVSYTSSQRTDIIYIINYKAII